MPGLNMVLNKIFHHRYLTVFWICLEFWICQCYTRSRRSTLFDSVLSNFPVLSMLGFKYTKLVDMPKLHICLCRLYYKAVTNISSNTSSLVLITSIFSKGLYIPDFSNVNCYVFFCVFYRQYKDYGTLFFTNTANTRTLVFSKFRIP